MSNSVWSHRRQPSRPLRPWDSPGKNIVVGCHFLLQCVKVKSESEVAQSSPTLSDPMDHSLPGSSIHGIFQARVPEQGAISFSKGSSWPRDWTRVSCLAGGFFFKNDWATRGSPAHVYRCTIYGHTHIVHLHVPAMCISGAFANPLGHFEQIRPHLSSFPYWQVAHTWSTSTTPDGVLTTGLVLEEELVGRWLW